MIDLPMDDTYGCTIYFITVILPDIIGLIVTHNVI